MHEQLQCSLWPFKFWKPCSMVKTSVLLTEGIFFMTFVIWGRNSSSTFSWILAVGLFSYAFNVSRYLPASKFDHASKRVNWILNIPTWRKRRIYKQIMSVVYSWCQQVKDKTPTVACSHQSKPIPVDWNIIYLTQVAVLHCLQHQLEANRKTVNLISATCIHGLECWLHLECYIPEHTTTRRR